MTMKKITVAEQLPANKKEFTIDVPEGDVTKQRFKGKFECSCVQTLGQKAESDLLQKKLNAGLEGALTEETKVFHLVVAQLSTRLTAAPQWWIDSDGGRNLLDTNVLYELYKQCVTAETDWRVKVWGEPKIETTLTNTDEVEAEKNDEAGDAGDQAEAV